MGYSEIQSKIDEALNLIRESKPVFGQAFENATDAGKFCELRLAGAEREMFLVLFLNAQHQLITDEIMFQGTVNAAACYPREIARRALELNAVSVILSHNHPSGNTEASPADIGLTRDVKQALGLFDISVLDHIIVADYPVSMANKGLM